MEQQKQAVRIQTSILNAAEKKVLVWLAERMPRWVTSDLLTVVGIFGAMLICAGYVLSNININWLWLSSAGLVVNWYGDSLDGTLARVRNQQRPRYGYFLDHNIDCINEGLMFIGAGLSSLMNLSVALLIYAAYLVLTVYVSINSHLKSEFKLTYGKMGPTEFRLIIIIVNTLFLYIPFLRDYSYTFNFFEVPVTVGMLDYIGIAIFGILLIMYVVSFIKDAKYFAELEPLKKNDVSKNK
ncbi:MAG: CDP-alcohol phosphatidyltransferase family protein [Bacteroidales bacterium]|nr:CDP-alcohol phosphatidyltransferase family protein [Bacteroidales bacterium]